MNKEVNIMLYVEDVQAELDFWQSIGFEILDQEEMMGYLTFTMKSHHDSTTVFTVYAKEFIEKVSPEVLNLQPSILFESSDLEALHKKVAGHSDTVSSIQQEPFPNFNFASPSGHYYAVRGVN